MDAAVNENGLEQLALVIPAFEPPESIVSYVDDALACGFGHIVVVNDGSRPKFAPIFQELSQRENVSISIHASNMGKGRSIKDGIARAHVIFPQLKGVVTVDCDGHHLMKDVVNVGKTLLAHESECVILGSRDLMVEGVSWRTRVGAQFTRLVNNIVYPGGTNITDGQTGLRAYSIALIPKLGGIAGERFEYETAVLMYAVKAGLEIVEVPISMDAVQIKSHYRPIRDTGRIILLATKLLLTFAASSLSSWLVDFILFTILVWVFTSPFVGICLRNATAILLATFLARVCSATLNFTLNRHKVFKSKGDVLPQILKFAVLACGILLCSATFVTAIQSWTSLPAPPIKVVVDLGLYFVNFRLQKRFIFKDNVEQQQASSAE